MYAHLLSVRFQKWRHGSHICFVDPHDNTVLTYISKSVQDRGLVAIIHIYRKSYMKFHLALFSLTLSDLERSIQVTQIFSGLYLQIYSR